MSNQEIYNTLAGLEAEFYYRHDRRVENENISADDLKTMDDKLRDIMTFWREVTGVSL